MAVNPLWLTIALRITAGVVFLRAYIKSARRSALLLSAGWISGIPISSGGAFDPRAECFAMGVSSAFTLLGIILLIEEESGKRSPRAMHVTLPLLPIMYGAVEASFGTSCTGTYITSGVLLLISGFIFVEMLSPYYRSKARLFGFVIAISGLASMMYPMLYEGGRLSSDLVVYISFILALLMAYAYYGVIYSRRFLELEHVKGGSPEDIDLSGSHVVSSKEFRDIALRLKGFPVLAFLRSSQPQDGWITYWIRTIDGPEAVLPTSMYKITEIVNQYLQELGSMGRKGVVVIEAPEFLKLYNDFRGVVKMLAAVRDNVIVHGGALIVVTEKDVWSEEEWNVLLRTLG